jgi:hypothetical protein
VSARALLLLGAALAFPPAGGALEPRFDHRDSHGPLAEALLARDTISVSGRGSASSWRPAVRAGWGIDVLGEGNELVAAADLALRSLDDPARERVLLAASLRYRTYFGTEELKTFVEAGVYGPIRSRLAVGPLVGLGVAYDVSRSGGVFAGGELASAFGEARIFSFALRGGAQLRFDLP